MDRLFEKIALRSVQCGIIGPDIVLSAQKIKRPDPIRQDQPPSILLTIRAA